MKGFSVRGFILNKFRKIGVLMREYEFVYMRYQKFPIVASFFILVVLLGLYFFVPAFNEAMREAFSVLTSGDEQMIKEWVSKFGMWGPLALIVAMVISMFLFVMPNLLLLIISSLSYGPLWGSVISLVAVFVSSSIAYAIGYSIGPVILRRLLKEEMRLKLTRLIRNYGVGTIILFRLSPILSNEAISFIPAALKMNYRRFITATMVGSAPVIGILAFTAAEGNFKPVLIWLSVISIVAYIVYIFIDIRTKKRRETVSVR